MRSPGVSPGARRRERQLANLAVALYGGAFAVAFNAQAVQAGPPGSSVDLELGSFGVVEEPDVVEGELLVGGFRPGPR
jgi:hypothetical protein